MASLSSVSNGDPIVSSNVNQFQEALSGQANYPISITGVNDGSLFALDVRNLDATNQRSFRVRNSSGENQIVADGTGVTISQIVVSSGTIAGSTFSGGTISTSALSLLAASSNTMRVPAARVTHASSQTLNSTVPTALTFNTEVYDSDGLHSTASSPTRLTPSRAGLWVFGGSVAFDANATGQRGLGLRLTGGDFVAFDRRQNTGSSQQTVVTVTAEAQLSTTDYVELLAQKTGDLGNLGIVASSKYSPMFWMSYRGAT